MARWPNGIPNAETNWTLSQSDPDTIKDGNNQWPGRDSPNLKFRNKPLVWRSFVFPSRPRSFAPEPLQICQSLRDKSRKDPLIVKFIPHLRISLIYSSLLFVISHYSKQRRLLIFLLFGPSTFQNFSTPTFLSFTFFFFLFFNLQHSFSIHYFLETKLLNFNISLFTFFLFIFVLFAKLFCSWLFFESEIWWNLINYSWKWSETITRLATWHRDWYCLDTNWSALGTLSRLYSGTRQNGHCAKVRSPPRDY